MTFRFRLAFRAMESTRCIRIQEQWLASQMPALEWR